MHRATAQTVQSPCVTDGTVATAAIATTGVGIGRATGGDGPDVVPADPSPAKSEMTLDPARVALVVIDPHADFLGPRCAAGPVSGGRAGGRQTVGNLSRLFQAAKQAGITVAISRTAAGLRCSGFVPELRPYIEADTTIICSPHKRYSPRPRVNDSGIQLRRKRVGQIILAGCVADLPLESHLRDFAEQGFEVAVVRDAIDGPKLPEGAGYFFALLNFRRIARALWTTELAVQALGRAGDLLQAGAKEITR